jgi:hypothetical protein
MAGRSQRPAVFRAPAAHRSGPPGRLVGRGIDILTVRDGGVGVVRTRIGFCMDA